MIPKEGNCLFYCPSLDTILKLGLSKKQRKIGKGSLGVHLFNTYN